MRVMTLGVWAMIMQCTVQKTLHEELDSALQMIQVETERLQNIHKKLKDMAVLVQKNEDMAQSIQKPEKDQFVAVFDGGSTGTRLNIYKFDAKGLTLKKHYFENVSPGIHQVENPEDVITTLLKGGKTFLAQNGHAPEYTFPVVFNGTAGLRLLDSSKRDGIMKAVKSTLIKHTGKKEVEVRVIDGKEEGFYAWAALVFVTQMKEKIGIIDLGGGSAQISFEIDTDVRKNEDGVVKGKMKNVLSRSFLGMGLVAGLNNIHKADTENVCVWETPTFDLQKCKKHIKNIIGNMIFEKTGEKEVAPGISQISTVFVSSFISEILRAVHTPKQAKFQDVKNLVDAVCVVPSANTAQKSSAESANTSPPDKTSVSRVKSVHKKNTQQNTNPLLGAAHNRDRDPKCVSVIYAVMFMESLGVGLFTPIKDATDIPTDISWSLGRALSLIE